MSDGAIGERVGRGAGDRREPALAPRRFLRSRASTWRLLKLAAAVLVALLVAFLSLLPIGRYLARAGWEEAKILLRRRPIAAIVADPATDTGVRAKLRVVLDARDFAADSLRMRVGESFTAYSALERDTLVLVLSGAYRDRLKRHTWWFPIVGSVPYKGFFDFDEARRAARDLDAEGLDVYLRPASAFSTLGFFNDPLLSTTLRLDSLELANTVIHELTHNTYYAPGQAVFNESFANFAGARGAAWFFRTRGATAAADETDRRWADQLVLGRFWTATYRSLDSAFARHADSKAARLAARDTVYTRARQLLVDSIAPRLMTIPPAAVARTRLDNAALLARRVYLTDLDLFDQVFEREGRDPRRAIDRVIELARSRPDDPYAAVREWVKGDGRSKE